MRNPFRSSAPGPHTGSRTGPRTGPRPGSHGGAERQPVHLHVGLKKTGTSYLQSILWDCQETVLERGVSMLPPTQDAMFALALDARGRVDPEADSPETARAVERLPDQAAAMTGRTGLITDESLASAPPEQIARLTGALGDRELHLVLTVRDLGRQLPSAWQQAAQAMGRVSYADYLASVVSGEGASARSFRGQHGLPGILDNWEQFIPRERVHVVTVPQRGAPPTTLLERFCSVLDLDPTGLTAQSPTTNASIGHLQAELLVRINRALPDHVRRRDLNGDVMKRYLAKRILEPQAGAPARVPREHEPWCRAASEETVARLVDGGYDVVGDVEDLLPCPDSFTDEDQSVDEAEMARIATDALVVMLTQRAEKRAEFKARRRQQQD